MARTSHALRSEDQVWLVDPFDDGPALREAASLGTPAGVFQLLDRHEVLRVLSRPGWREVALWWEREHALIVAEAVGTAPAFALGRRAGVHPMLRLTPPRSQFAPYRPSMLLVGHGPAIEADAATALDDALAHARSDIPRLVRSLPQLMRQ